MAAASMASFFFAILILSLFGKGFCQSCDKKTLHVSQENTGKEVQGKPEYKVTVTSTCICTQLDVTLSSPGFSTVEKPDASVVTVGVDGLNLTQPLHWKEPVDFNYAWGKQFSFTPNSSGSACS